MNFLNFDYDSMPKDRTAYSNHYESGYNCFSRNIALMHSLGYLIDVKKAINYNRENDISVISDSQIKGIKFEDSSEFLAQAMAEQFEAIQAELKEGEELGESHIFRLVINTFKN
jgi:hypothetical protein